MRGSHPPGTCALALGEPGSQPPRRVHACLLGVERQCLTRPGRIDTSFLDSLESTTHLAIISHDRASRVEETEIQGLAVAFESLRGQGTHHQAHAGDHARLLRTNATGDSQIDRDALSWVASFGLVLHDGSLLRQPLEALDGQFALVSLDASTAEIVVATDPLGLQALYVAERRGKTYVSTSALALAKHLRAQPNRFALQVFLRTEYHLGILMHWEGIERLDPGIAIAFTEQGRQRWTYWRHEIDETVNKLSFKQASDHLIETATGTFREHLDADRCYDTNLTGGYDIRLLNLLLRRAGIHCRTNTRGGDSHPDVRIA